MVNVEHVRYDGAPNDKCSGLVDMQDVRMKTGKMNTQGYSHFCLNKSQRYKMKITFNQYNPSEPVKGAKIFIDSVKTLVVGRQCDCCAPAAFGF